jgi:diguanylate cyclase (GGDEF)-like protein
MGASIGKAASSGTAMPTDHEPTASSLKAELAELRLQVAELQQVEGHLRRAEQLTQDALRYADDVLQTVREPLLVLDGDLRVRTANRSFFDTFRRTPSETIGCHLYELGGREWDLPRLRTLLEEILPEDTQLVDFEVEADFRGIGHKVMLLNAARIESRGVASTTILLAIEDTTERRRTEQDLLAVAITDGLTGLYNRRALFALAAKVLERSRREQVGCRLAFIDLDDLKGINDRLGHSEGDRALIDTAGILRNTFRESDIIARYGGDEFVVVPVGTPGDDPGSVVTRLERAIAAHNQDGGRPYTLLVSVGIADWDAARGGSLERLIAEGDAAMYREKWRRRRESKSPSSTIKSAGLADPDRKAPSTH